jgi:hypothetical protein
MNSGPIDLGPGCRMYTYVWLGKLDLAEFINSHVNIAVYNVHMYNVRIQCILNGNL